MDNEEKKILLALAKNTIAKNLNLPYKKIDASMYKEKKGAFVTLSINGKLRGCIGYIFSIAPLFEQMTILAIEASTEDPRFPPITKDEFLFIDIEISIISEPLEIFDLSQFQLSRDGIILKIGSNKAVFLPQVADETGWNKEDMLTALSHKAGLDGEAYKNSNARFWTFTAEVFHDL